MACLDHHCTRVATCTGHTAKSRTWVHYGLGLGTYHGTSICSTQRNIQCGRSCGVLNEHNSASAVNRCMSPAAHHSDDHKQIDANSVGPCDAKSDKSGTWHMWDQIPFVHNPQDLNATAFQSPHKGSVLHRHRHWSTKLWVLHEMTTAVTVLPQHAAQQRSQPGPPASCSAWGSYVPCRCPRLPFQARAQSAILQLEQYRLCV